jgi:class 3 adenylate cyclase
MPTGRVAFFFTDLEGSTRQWEAQPDLMHLAVSRHDELITESIEHWDGIVFSTAGDGFVAAFPRVVDAVSAAVEIQRVLTDEQWPQPIAIKARMGIHVGFANMRGGNYFGSVVNRTARIMATGHGGQVLLSDEARTACPDADVVDLGIHYLKDLSAPEHVWQVLIEGLTNDFPALRSLDRVRANLPTQLSGFVGRSQEIADVLELLESNRLVTLRGLGGIGKTRLSLQVAAESVGQSVDMVRFVALAARRSDPRRNDRDLDRIVLHPDRVRQLRASRWRSTRTDARTARRVPQPTRPCHQPNRSRRGRRARLRD